MRPRTPGSLLAGSLAFLLVTACADAPSAPDARSTPPALSAVDARKSIGVSVDL
ncbi:MAG: hypothetical protein JO180_11095, partial [Gemmatirosa sp.]|nr:hypothetical protein [Gemmatirosa sp.]